MAIVTRDQGAELRQGQMIIGKIFQKDRTVPDAELTEIGQIAQYRTARLLANITTRQHVRFDTGWVITGGTNKIYIAAGDASFVMTGNDHSYLYHLASNTDVTFTTPGSGTRTDYVYVDLEIAEVNATTDPDLLNPVVAPDPDYGQETSIDNRFKMTLVGIQGASVPSAPAGHVYVTIATIVRTTGVDLIGAGDITQHLVTFPLDVPDSILVEPYIKADGTRQLAGDLSVASGKLIDGCDLSEFNRHVYAQSYTIPEGTQPHGEPIWETTDYNDTIGTWHFPPLNGFWYYGVWCVWKEANDNYLIVAWEQSGGGQKRIYMGSDTDNNIHVTTGSGAWLSESVIFDVSDDLSFPVGTDLSIRWRSDVLSTGHIYVRKFRIYTTQHI